MGWQDSQSRDEEESLLFVPTTSNQGERTEEYRSQVTRDSDSSLRISLPCRGLSRFHGYVVFISMMVFFTLFVGGIGLSIEVIGPLGVLIAAFDIIVCIAIQFEVKRYSCTEIDLKITRETVLLTRKVLNWDQFMDLMLRIRPPIHPRERFNEVEVDMSNFEYPLTPSLEAEVIGHAPDDLRPKHIKLGPVNVGHGLSNDEVEWLAREINHFLLETR